MYSLRTFIKTEEEFLDTAKKIKAMGYDYAQFCSQLNEEWANICEDYRVFDVEMTQELDLVPHYKKVLKSNLRWGYSATNTTSIIALVDKYSGDSLSATSKNHFYEDVGVLYIEHNGSRLPVLSVFSFSNDNGQLDNGLPWMKFTQDLVVFVPKDYDGIVLSWAENAAVYTKEEREKIDEYESSTNEPWRTSNLKDENTLYKEKDYYFATIPPVTE